MDNIAAAFTGPWILLGDFNTVLSQAEKTGGRPVTSSSASGLTGIITKHGLIDVGFSSSPFTWSNGRSGMANIQARLDRGLVNEDWRLLFPDAQLFHLPVLQSDHKPLLMQLKRKVGFHPRPFRFEGMWTLDRSSYDVIRQAWHSDLSGSPLHQVVRGFKNFVVAMKRWNRKVFGQV